jgi:hypothetical protein
MTTADREHAAQHLLAFLLHVGPLEAIWAMTTALEELQEQPASGDHVANARRAFAESLVEADDLAAQAAADAPARRGKKSPAAAAPAANGEQL